MKKRGWTWALALITVVVSGSLPIASEPVEPNPVEDFALMMIRGIGAEETACKHDMRKEVESRRMNILCARFEGTFARFEIRWDLEMMQRERPDPRSLGTVEPPVFALTDWEATEGEYDRIYRVAGKAIGVRFNGGDVLMVW
jgi:hypothetical protein